MLLLADWVIPVSSPPLADAGVRVAEGRITEVGPAAQLRARYEGEEARSFPGCVLLPGFVDSHTHLELSAFRGFCRPSGFGRWMLDLLVARRKLDREDYEASAVWGAVEALRCGITTVADTAYDGLAVARAAAVTGLRARVYQEVFGLDDSALPRTMERYEAVMGRLRAEAVAAPPDVFGTALVEAGVSPHAPYTVSARLYREAARFARRAGLRLATHVAESPAEVEVLTRGTGPIAAAYRMARLWSHASWDPPRLRPLEYVARAGALWPDTLAVHAVEVEAEEIALLAESGAAVAHCPRSNSRLGCAVAPVADYLAAGIRVGLGTDSLASNDSLDMFAEMRAALAAAERRSPGDGRYGEPPAQPAGGTERNAGSEEEGWPSPLTPEQVLSMATLEGARALGWERATGSIEQGKSADLVVVRTPDRRKPAAGVVETVVLGASAKDVVLTMLGGRVVSAAGEAPAVDLSGYRAARQKLGLPV